MLEFMQHIHDIIRDRLYQQKGLVRITPKEFNLEKIKESEWDSNFAMLQMNRLVMGYLRYGSVWKQKIGKYNYLKSVKNKIEQYEKTGNTELLVDIANYMMIMFTLDGHPNKHFNATDDKDHCQIK